MEKPFHLRKIFISFITMCLVVILSAYGALSWQRYVTIRDVTTKAQIRFSGDRIELLIAYLNSDLTSLEEKNKTIWVLGELREEKAIPAIQVFSYLGECDHNFFVCQKELQKAVRKIKRDLPNPYFWQNV